MAAVLHLIVWGVSLGCACAIAVESQNEPVSAWCWFQAVQHGGAIQVATTGTCLSICFSIIYYLLSITISDRLKQSCILCAALC